MKKFNKKEKNKIDKRLQELVIARIEAQMSSNLKLSIGNGGSLDKTQIIEHIEKGDEIGRQIVQSHLNFIRAQSSGQLISALNSI